VFDTGKSIPPSCEFLQPLRALKQLKMVDSYRQYEIQPDYPAALGLVSHLNDEELKELLNDDSRFDDMMKDVKQVSFSVLLYCIRALHCTE
jgi:hypothetical protein